MGLNLRAFREARGLTQQDVERATGIPQRTISNVEAGTEPKGPTLRALESWADHLAKRLRLKAEERLDFAYLTEDRTE